MSMIINPYRYATAGGGGLVFVGGTSSSPIDGGGGSLSLTSLTGGIGTAAAIGDIVIVAVAYGSTANRSGSLPGGYTSLVSIGADDNFDCELRVGYKVLSSADTGLTVGGTGNVADASGVAVHVWRNINATPIDVTTTTATGINAATPDPPAITPVTAGAIILVIGGAAGGTLANFSGPSMGSGLEHFFEGWGADTNDGHVAMYSKTNWTSGAFDPTAFSGGGGAGTSCWCAATIALRPA